MAASDSTRESAPAVGLPLEQRRIRRGAALAAGLCALVLVTACQGLPHFFSAPQDLTERLAFALQADLFVLLWVAIGAQLVSTGRYRSAADNRGSAFGPPSPRIAIQVAFLQNTLEQSVMAIGAHLALATLVSGPALFYIPGAVLLFAIGRIAFLAGYRRGAGARSFGMATTAIPTLVATGWAITLVVRKLIA